MKKILKHFLCFIMSSLLFLSLSLDTAFAGLPEEKRIELELHNNNNDKLYGVSCDFILPDEPIVLGNNNTDFFCCYLCIGANVEGGISFTRYPFFTDPKTHKKVSVTTVLGKTEKYWAKHGYWRKLLKIYNCSKKYPDFFYSVPMTNQPDWGSKVKIKVQVKVKSNKPYVECYINNSSIYDSVLCDKYDPIKDGFVRVCQGADDTSRTVSYNYAESKNIKILKGNGNWYSSNEDQFYCRNYNPNALNPKDAKGTQNENLDSKDNDILVFKINGKKTTNQQLIDLKKFKLESLKTKLG